MSVSDNIRKEILAKLQGLSETITDSVGEIAQGNNIFCSQEIINQRLAVCKACPEFIAMTSQCRKCGCFMSAKTRLRTASCPIDKWGKSP